MSQLLRRAALSPVLNSFVDASRRGVGVRVRVSAGARTDRVEGIAADAHGRARLRIAVRAAPERGQANAAVIALLAREWMLTKSNLRIVAGASDRRKIVGIAGDPDAILDELTRWAGRRFPW